MAHLSGSNSSDGSFAAQASFMKPVEQPSMPNYHHDMDGDRYPAIRPVKDYMVRTGERAAKCNERRGMVDRRQTEYANKLAVADFVEDQHNGFNKDHVEMTRIVTGFVNSTKANLAAKAGVSAGSNAREIRDRLVAMSHEDRLTAIREAAVNGDRDTLGAVVGLSKLMTGIDPAIVQPLYEDFQRREAPQEYQAVKDAEKYAGYIAAMPKDMFAWRVRALSGTEAQAAAQRAFDAIYTGYDTIQNDPAPNAAE